MGEKFAWNISFARELFHPTVLGSEIGGCPVLQPSLTLVTIFTVAFFAHFRFVGFQEWAKSDSYRS